jgi:hypothetical protein
MRIELAKILFAKPDLILLMSQQSHGYKYSMVRGLLD